MSKTGKFDGKKKGKEKGGWKGETSSLKMDARGAELKRGGIKGSIRIGPRRRISCVIRREPRASSS